MIQPHKPFIILTLFFLLSTNVYSFSSSKRSQHGNSPGTYFNAFPKPNAYSWEGKWNGVQLYITDFDIRFCWLNPQDMREVHDLSPKERLKKNLNGGALFISFPQSQKINPEPIGMAMFDVNQINRGLTHATKAWRGWKTSNLWPGVDYSLEADGDALKSTFFLQAGIDPTVVKWKYQGAERLTLDEGKLVIHLKDGRMEEHSPLVYQTINGKKVEIPASFQISNETVSFKLSGTYDNLRPLVLDPTLVFVSYSGSLADNWGFTATPGPEGRLYSGGIAFGAGFPVTPGAFQVGFMGGSGSSLHYDAALLAFAPQGDTLIWATYLGGSGNEQPHSMIVNFSDSSLYVMGTTNSADFPVTQNAFDTTINGDFDLFVAHFSPKGALLHATFLGGSGTDGINTALALKPNHGDDYRGEIILDHDDNVVIGSCTNSPDFPVLPGMYQSTGRVALDGIVARFDAKLSKLKIAVVVGSEGEEAVFSIKQLPLPSTSFVLGMVSNGSLPIVNQAPFRTKPGGVDGYVGLLSGDGKTMRASTWFGSSTNDWLFFVETGYDGLIYINGQNQGTVPRVGNSYHVPNSGQFIAAFDSTLTQLKWSGNYGSGRGIIDMVPTAFLVDDCGKVYISGSTGKISIPQQIGPTNLPLTADSIMGSANGYDFYMACWSAGFDSLLFATYYGGPISQEHVDGGTSRFDKKGVIYQSVCAGCGGRSDFPVSSGTVVSPVNRALNCNNAVIKLAFELSNPIVADFSIPLNKPFCPPFNPEIINPTTSTSGTSWLWTTSDGQQSTDSLPSFVFNKPGNYVITLRATNPLNCNLSSSISRNLTVNAPPQSFLPLSDTCLCNSESFELEAPMRFPVYQWIGLNAGSNRVITIETSGSYVLTVSDSNGCQGSDTANVTLVPCSGDGYNVFTPNQDGKNDVFHPIPTFKESSEWVVYNRWGQKVFESSETEQSWNGRRNNHVDALEESVYFFEVKAILCGENRSWRGRVMLLR